jgi:hypothetical protein
MMITISVFLIISFLANIVLVWYCRKLTSQFLFFSENLEGLEASLQSFDEHLKSIYELEMFYGDDTLESLIKHSKDLLQSVGDFNDSFSLETYDDEGMEDGDS